MAVKKEQQGYPIWIEAEEWALREWKPEDDNTDVIVTYQDGHRWVAIFFAYQNIATLTKKNKQTGECFSGAYFWASDMVLIDVVSHQRIEEVINYLIKEKKLEYTFTLLPPQEEQRWETNGRS